MPQHRDRPAKGNQASGVRFGIIRHGINVGHIAHFRQGVWAATTTIAMVRRMEWRPPLLYVNPSSHRVSATLKISQKCVKQQPKNERAVRARCYARCARCVCFPLRQGGGGNLAHLSQAWDLHVPYVS